MSQSSNPVKPASMNMHKTLITARLPITIAYYIAFIALGLVVASMGPTLSRLAENTQTSVGQISLLFTAKASGFIIGSLLGGYLYDRISGHPVLASMMILIDVGFYFVPIISVFWVLF